MKKMLGYVLGCCCFLLLFGCADDLGTSSYSRGEVGQINRVVPASVVSMRPIMINDSSGMGGLVGLGAGAIAGSAIGGSTRANLLGGLGGAVIGGIAGNAIEKGITKKKGMEYVLRESKNKTFLTVTQLQDLQLYVGQKVLIIYGQKTRIVPDNGNGY